MLGAFVVFGSVYLGVLVTMWPVCSFVLCGWGLTLCRCFVCWLLHRVTSFAWGLAGWGRVPGSIPGVLLGASACF